MKIRIHSLIIVTLITFNHCYSQNQDSLLNQRWINLKAVLIRKVNHVKELSDLLSKSSKSNKHIRENAQTLAQQFSRTLNATEKINSWSIKTITTENQQLNIALNALIEESSKFLKSKKWSHPLIEVYGQLEGCENRISYAKNQYNDICHQYGLSEMFFGSYEPE